MSSPEVSRRYAKALLELTKQKGTHVQALGELKTVSEVLMADTNAREYFSSPLVSPDQKQAAIKGALANKGLMEDVYSLLLLLAEKNRISILTDVVSAFQDCIDKEEGVTRGTVLAAKSITPEAQKDLETKIAKILGKKIVLSYKEDQSLLGGAVAQVGGWTFDDSIETHLKRLNEELNRSAN